MPWNGSGQFDRDTGVFTGATVWDDSRIAGRTVRSDDHDTHDEDIATGLENTVTRDGQNSPSANLPMATFRHTGVGNAAARTDYAAAGQIQDQGLTHVVAASVGGTGDVITLSPTPAITAYAAGQRWSFLAESTNTGATTVDVSSVGTRAVQKLGAALVAGDITTGDLVVIEDDGTQFQMLTPARTPVLVSNIALNILDITDTNGNEVHSFAETASAVNELTTTNAATGNAPALSATGDDTNIDLKLVGKGTGRVDNILPRSYLAGLGFDNGTDASHDIDVSVGECRDDANSEDIVLSSAITKQIDAAWAVGTNQGGLDGTESVPGTPDANTWYHIWLIKRTDTGVVDVLFSESATSPTLPTNYDKKRRIGAVLTNGIANILGFSQEGDEFLWDTPSLDYNSSNPGTSAVLRALQVTTGIKVRAIHSFTVQDTNFGGSTYGAIVTSPDQNDVTASSSTNHTLLMDATSAADDLTEAVSLIIRTDTSAQIRTRIAISAATITVRGTTFGYIDRRGRDD